MAEWIVETLNETVDLELEALPDDIRSRFVRISNLLEQFGPHNVGMPHIRSLGDKLWEIRASGRDGIARGIYIVATRKSIGSLKKDDSVFFCAVRPKPSL